MLKTVEGEDGSNLRNKEIVDLEIKFLNPGHESSGHAAMWPIVLLEEHPEVFQKAKVNSFISLASKPKE